MKCSKCGAPTDAICRVCDPCITAFVERTTAEQGVEFPLRDPVRLDRLASIVRAPFTKEVAA